MAESLPTLRYPIYADYTEAVDLGGKRTNNWVSDDGGDPEERVYICYDFTASEGYTARQDDFSVEGQAVKFEYDLTKNVYAGKRQFVLGAYAYLLDKSMEFSGHLNGGTAKAYLSGTNKDGRIKLLRGLSDSSLAEGEQFFDDLRVNTYQPVDRMYICPRMGVTSSGLLVNESYSGRAELRFSGVEGEHPPYIDVVAEDVIPSVTDVQPVNQFADPNRPITLRWRMTYDDLRYATFEGIGKNSPVAGRVYGSLSQKSARVRWTIDGKTIHEMTVGSEGECVIPAGQVDSRGFRWQVDVCSSDDVWSESNDLWYQVQCDNDSLSTATALRPQKITIDGTVENTFYWEHHNESGSVQTAADLQYSVNGTEWISFGKTVGEFCECVIAGNTLPAGTIWWRVRTYNASGVAGEWSAAVPLTVRSAPKKPLIVHVGETPQPWIRWDSDEQVAAEIQIDGIARRVYGKTQEMKWQEILENGAHVVKIRVQNLYGLWSGWTEISVDIVNYPQNNFQLSAEVTDHSVRLKWNQSFAVVQVWRDENCIGTLTEQQLEFLDHGSILAVSYRLRGITDEGYYTDSNLAEVVVDVAGAVLRDAGESAEWIRLKGRYKAVPEHSCHWEQTVLFRRYSAQNWSKAFPSQQWTAKHQFSFSLAAEELDLLGEIRALSGRKVIYKDARGELVCGILTEVVSVHRGLYMDVEFNIVQAELEEGALL